MAYPAPFGVHGPLSCANGLSYRTPRPQDGSARLACDLHCTDMTNGVVMKKTSPRQAAEAALVGLEANMEEVLVAPSILGQLS